MPRGWRNDPRWVQIYEQRRREREARDAQRNMVAGMALAQQTAPSRAEYEAAMHRNRIPPQPHPFIRVVHDETPF